MNEFICRTEPVQTGLSTRQNSSLMSRDTNVQRGHQSLSHNSDSEQCPVDNLAMLQKCVKPDVMVQGTRQKDRQTDRQTEGVLDPVNGAERSTFFSFTVLPKIKTNHKFFLFL